MAAEDRDVLFKIGFTEHPGASQALGKLADEISKIQQMAESGSGKFGEGVSKSVSAVASEASDVKKATEQAGTSVSGMTEHLTEARSMALGMAAAFGTLGTQVEGLDHSQIESLLIHLQEIANTTDNAESALVQMIAAWDGVAGSVNVTNAQLRSAAVAGGEAADGISLVGDHADVLKQAADTAAELGDNMATAEGQISKTQDVASKAKAEITAMSEATDSLQESSGLLDLKEKFADIFAGIEKAGDSIKELKKGYEDLGSGGAAATAAAPAGPPPDGPSGSSLSQDYIDNIVASSEEAYMRLDSFRKQDGESIEDHEKRLAASTLKEVDDVRFYASVVGKMATQLEGYRDVLKDISVADAMDSEEAGKALEESMKAIESFVKDSEALDARLSEAEQKRIDDARRAAEEIAAARASETAAISRAAKETVAHYNQIGSEIDQANQRVETGTRAALASVTTLGQGLGKITRGLTIMNILDEEDSAEILKTVGQVQALIDTVGGLTHTVTGAIRGWDGLTKMLTGSRTAKEKEREQTELAMKSSKLMEEALRREALTARQTAKAHEMLGRARAGKAAKHSARNAAGFGGLGRPGSMATGPSYGVGAGGVAGAAGGAVAAAGGAVGGAAGELTSTVADVTMSLDSLKNISPRMESAMTKLGKSASKGISGAMTKIGNVGSKVMGSKLGRVAKSAGGKLSGYAMSAGGAFKAFAGGTAAAAAGLAAAVVAAAAGIAFAGTSIYHSFGEGKNAVGGYNDTIASAEVSTLSWIGTTTGAFDLVGDSATALAEEAAWASQGMSATAIASETLASTMESFAASMESQLRMLSSNTDSRVFDQNKSNAGSTEDKMAMVDSRIEQLKKEQAGIRDNKEIERIEGEESEAIRKIAVLERIAKEEGELTEKQQASFEEAQQAKAKAAQELAQSQNQQRQELERNEEELLTRQKERMQLTKQQQSEATAAAKAEISAIERVIDYRQREIDKIVERGEADKKSYAESRKAALETAEDRFAAMSKSQQRRALELAKDLRSGKKKAEDLNDRDADLLGNVGGDFAKDQLRKRNAANARANGFDGQLLGINENKDRDFKEREAERQEELQKQEAARRKAVQDLAKKNGITEEEAERKIEEREKKQKETGARVDIIDKREIEVKIESQFEDKIDSINNLIIAAIRKQAETEEKKIRDMVSDQMKKEQEDARNKSKQGKQTSKD